MSKKIPHTNNNVLSEIDRAEVDEMVDQILEQLRNRPQSKQTGITLSKARATSHVTDRMQGYGLQPLRHNELKSIYALFAWVANEQGAAEETVQCIIETRFGVSDVTNLQQKDYDEVIKFLVDLRIDELQH